MKKMQEYSKKGRISFNRLILIKIDKGGFLLLRNLRLITVVFVLIFSVTIGTALAAEVAVTTPPALSPTASAQPQYGWSFPFLGAGKGYWDTSVGLFLHEEGNVTARNFQFKSGIDIAPGLRWQTVVRSNRELDTLRGWHPYFDENFIEAYAFHKDPKGVFSGSLRIGNIRYLHFPYPDAIAMFDTVPTTSEFRDGTPSGYAGELLTLDYAGKNGLGIHTSGIRWSFGRSGGSQVLEDYVFYRHDFGLVHFETHVGGLAERTQPLGKRDNGYNVYIGSISKGTTIGFLYEKLQSQTAYTGVMMTFPMDKVTKALGSVAFDWDRRPAGYAAQIPLIKGTFGGIQKTVPKNGVLVGEITAERLKTYCSNGQARNFYEHRLSSWGETGTKDLIVVMLEDPWYLQAEAVVSPHNFNVGFKTWDRDRTGPAQLSQTVHYKFYRVNQ